MDTILKFWVQIHLNIALTPVPTLSAQAGMPSERAWSLLAAVEPGLQALVTRGGECSTSVSEYLQNRRHPGGEILLSDFPPEEMLQLLKVGD